MTNTRPCVSRVAAAVLLACDLLASPAWAYTDWRTYRDDDGTLDSPWGLCGTYAQVLRKTFVVEQLAGATDAMIQYEMAEQP